MSDIFEMLSGTDCASLVKRIDILEERIKNNEELIHSLIEGYFDWKSRSPLADFEEIRKRK